MLVFAFAILMSTCAIGFNTVPVTFMFLISLCFSSLFCKIFVPCFDFITLFFFSEGVHFCPRWSGRLPDWQRLLGALLSGAWHPTRRPDAVRQGKLIQCMPRPSTAKSPEPAGSSMVTGTF
jgi:hypothetical protein